MKTLQNKKPSRFAHRAMTKHPSNPVRHPPRPSELSRREVRRIVLDILG
ncbi:MAG TPA: hypothetical protein VK597_06740 [Inquilinus sp.]|nr:hypothetical protein [Inquilinus sp.]